MPFLSVIIKYRISFLIYASLQNISLINTMKHIILKINIKLELQLISMSFWLISNFESESFKNSMYTGLRVAKRIANII